MNPTRRKYLRLLDEPAVPITEIREDGWMYAPDGTQRKWFGSLGDEWGHLGRIWRPGLPGLAGMERRRWAVRQHCDGHVGMHLRMRIFDAAFMEIAKQHFGQFRDFAHVVGLLHAIINGRDYWFTWAPHKRSGLARLTRFAYPEDIVEIVTVTEESEDG